MKKVLHNQNGSALLIALCLTMMLALIGIMAAKNSDTDIDLSFYQVHSEKAFYIAEAGAKRACAELIKDKTWDSSFSNVIFSNGAYDVQLTDSSDDASLIDTMIVTSRGWTPDATAIVEIVMVPELIYPWRHALFADDGVDIQNSLNTDSYNTDSGSYFLTHDDSFGDVGSNSDITIANGAFIGGDVVTSLEDGADVNIGATVTGIVSDEAPEVELPSIPQSVYDDAALNNENLTGISGAYTYDILTHTFSADGAVVLNSGVYYFSSFTLLNSASVLLTAGAVVKIYVTGNIEIKNSGEINPTEPPSSLQFFTQGDIILKNSGVLTAVFYAPDGDVDLRNSSDFFGSIASSTIIGHNSAGFHYDRMLYNIDIGESDHMRLVAWREL